MTTSSNGNSSLEIGQSNQELILSKGRKQKRVCIIASVILSIVVLALIIAAIILLKSSGTETLGLTQKGDTLALEDVLYGTLNPKGFNASWISGDKLLYRSDSGNLMIHNVKTKTSQILLPPTNPILESALEYELSHDQKYLMVSHEFIKLYRYSFFSKYSIIDLESKNVIPIKFRNDDLLQYAKWSPVGNSIVFVLHNNIFYKPSVTESATQLTTDGIPQTIYNGIPDWVYEEEVLSSNQAVWFSPDGKKLAYAKFNDSLVPYMTLPVYGQPGSLEFQYTRAIQIRYPKPGTQNPDVSLHVVDLAELKNELLVPPLNLVFREPILAAVSWATDNIVSAIWMNRVQNEAIITTYDASDVHTSVMVKNITETSGWVDLFKPPIFSKDGSKMLVILSQNQRNHLGSYRHLTMLERKVDAEAQPLTSGAFVVTEILGWDESNDLVYYQANTEEDPAVQHVFSVSTTTKKSKCISCGHKTSLQQSKCLHNSAKFSTDYTHYILNCAGPGVPEMSVWSTPNKSLEVWENNENLVKLLHEKSIPVIKRMKIPVAGGFNAEVMLKLPPNMITSGDVKYPMLVNVYGGPDSNQISEKFNLEWGSYLAANKSIIYVSIDGRGSGLKGDKMMFAGYRKIGTVEVVDQINVTRQIQQTLPYVDPARTAIWGWSYGGYASGMALAEDKEGVFKCGISVAPVTDWTLYDSIYTERFMGLPVVNDNLQGYVNAQLLNKYEGLRDKKYFLVHGTLDDNVHYQQSMLWSKVLEHKDIIFRQQSYPDEDHGLISVRPHLYHTLENFLDECFISD